MRYYHTLEKTAQNRRKICNALTFILLRFTISKVLGRDLVAMFTQPTEEEQRTKVVLHIEIEKEKSDEVLRYIKDKNLYEILKSNNT